MDTSVYVYGDTTDDLNDAQGRKADLNSQLDNVQKEIAQLQQQSNDTQAYIAQLDQKMNTLDQSVNKLNTDIAAKQEEIVQAEQGLQEAEERSQEQYEAMKLRIQFMYEHNPQNYVEILMSAGNMGELLNKAEYIREISEYDRTMLQEYQENIEYIANTKTLLENDHARLDEMLTSVEADKAALSVVQQAKNEELMALKTQTNQAQQKESSLHADLAQQENEIAAMEAKIAAEEAAREAAREAAKKAAEEASRKAQAELDKNKNDGDATLNPTKPSINDEDNKPSRSGFIWPTVSRRITSDYGDMEDRSSPHRGIDIGATVRGVSGDPIYAAASGTVTLATYSSSAGNWIWVYHGDGLYTVYMHCSALLVSEGDTVSQGQVIGRMGSTGISTGAHLHFGVRLNGSYVNPWNYVG